MSAYLVGAAFFCLLWGALFSIVPRIRAQMLTASLGLAHFGPFLQYWYLKDYWTPQYFASARIGGVTIAPEDYLFGFALMGIAAGLFELTRPACGDHGARRSMIESWLRLQIAGGLFIISMCVLVAGAGTNSVHATIAICIVGASLIFGAEPKWFARGVATGFALAIVFFAFYELFYLPLYPTIIDDWWHSSALTGLRLGGVPIEEVAWGFAMGIFIGPLVRMCRTAAGEQGAVAETPRRQVQ